MGALGRFFRPQCGPDGTPRDDVFMRATGWGPVGWRPVHAVPPWQQIGAYGDAVLTSRFTFNPGVQLRSRGFNPSGWQATPGTLAPQWQLSRRPSAPVGAQRSGSQVPGGLTPWTAAQMRAQLVRAQVAQSGLSSVSFTRALIRANMETA